MTDAEIQIRMIEEVPYWYQRAPVVVSALVVGFWALASYCFDRFNRRHP